jgi:hypothetical protein
MPKSDTLMKTVVDAENEGLVEVAFTVIVVSPFPTVLICRVVVLEPPMVRVRVDFARVGTAVPPELWTVRVTGPEKLPSLVIVMVELAEDPDKSEKVLGLAVIAKPTIVTVMLTGGAVTVPLDAETLTE